MLISMTPHDQPQRSSRAQPTKRYRRSLLLSGLTSIIVLVNNEAAWSAEPAPPNRLPTPPAKTEQIGKWMALLSQPPPDRLAARDALAKRQAEAAFFLLRMGKSDPAWALLRHSADPSARSYFIRDVGRSGVPANLLITQLETESDVSVRRALVLALGSYTGEQIPHPQRSPLIDRLLRLYRDDPDAGVHSAIDWLLTHSRQGHTERQLAWGESQALAAIDEELAGKAPERRKWFVAKSGQTFAIIDGPVEVTMGSPGNEPGRDKVDDLPHRVRIPRSFAVATKEVTVGLFQQFLDANPEIKSRAKSDSARDPTREGRTLKRFDLDDTCPQVSMTWFEAAQFCNWASAQEGLPASEWCYPPLDETKEGVVLAKDHLTRTGYRLLTEAEWEYACRAGTRTARFFGNSDELLSEYAWYAGNTFEERPWPVGQLKPNDWGLFDTYGNVWEWIHDPFQVYAADSRDLVREDGRDVALEVSKNFKRARRGGSFSYGPSFMRSAYRNSYIPDERRDSVGFRVGRTLATVAAETASPR
jgi:formylglycine-generating enzyme required for sulfatase activity